MSRKKRSHDVVCGFREPKMESSAGEGGGISKATRGLFLEEWDKIEGIWVDGMRRNTQPIHSARLRSSKIRLDRAPVKQ